MSGWENSSFLQCKGNNFRETLEFSPPRAPGLTLATPLPTAQLKRGLTRSQPDSSRRGGNPRSPRTGISAQVQRGRSSESRFSSWPRISSATCSPGRLGAERGDPPLCPSSRGSGDGPPPARALRLCAGRRPGKPSNGPLPPSRRVGGELSYAASPRPPRQVLSLLTPGWGLEGPTAAAKSSEARASRRSPACIPSGLARWFPPRRALEPAGPVPARARLGSATSLA